MFAPLLTVVFGCAPAPGINAIAGDASWIEARGVAPGPAADEDERIAVHLRWVTGRLRAAPVDHLPDVARRARGALLGALDRYTLARVFPRHPAGGEGRRPRFVDAAGRHCAVAALIRATAGPTLVATVQAAHETDLIADMKTPGLLRWARAHGVELHELALIQPSYDDGSSVHVPDPIEERWAAEAREREAKIPRPLRRSHVRDVVDRFDPRAATRTCAPERTGHWRMRTTVVVQAGLQVRAAVRIHGAAARVVAVERCLERALAGAMTRFIGSARHTLRRPIRYERTRSVDVATPGEIEGAVLGQTRRWRGPGTRAAHLAGCLGGQGPIRVPLRVSGHDGRVLIRWDALPARPPDTQARWHCIGDVLGYGRSSTYGFDDHDFDVDVLPDGRLGEPRS